MLGSTAGMWANTAATSGCKLAMLGCSLRARSTHWTMVLAAGTECDAHVDPQTEKPRQRSSRIGDRAITE